MWTAAIVLVFATIGVARYPAWMTKMEIQTCVFLASLRVS
jgi:hypothetical protein